MKRTKLKINVNNGSWMQNLFVHAAMQHYVKVLEGFKGKRVHITLSFIKDLRHSKNKCRAMAFQDSPLRYSIHMDRDMKPVMFMRCLAHELIHVNQWLTGKMQDLTGRTRVRWGKRIIDPGKLAYKKHPWEKEAFRHDTKLGNKFMKAWGRGQ